MKNNYPALKCLFGFSISPVFGAFIITSFLSSHPTSRWDGAWFVSVLMEALAVVVIQIIGMVYGVIFYFPPAFILGLIVFFIKPYRKTTSIILLSMIGAGLATAWGYIVGWLEIPQKQYQCLFEFKVMLSSVSVIYSVSAISALIVALIVLPEQPTKKTHCHDLQN